MEPKHIEYIEKYYYKVFGLLVAYSIPSAIVVLLESIIKDKLEIWIKLLIYIPLFIIVTLIWLYFRYKLPTNIGKIGLIIAIETENKKQSLRVKKDFANQIEELIDKHGLSNMFNVIVTNEYQSLRINNAIKPFLKRRKELRDANQYTIDMNFKEKKVWGKIDKKLNGNFIIYGQIYERLEIKNEYILKLNAMVKHQETSKEFSNMLQKDFLSIFPKEIKFYEELEVKGFELASNLIYISVRFIVGVAAFLSKSPYQAYKIHYGLEQEFSRLGLTFKYYKSILGNLKKWISSELSIMSKYEYYERKDNEKAEEYLKKSLEEDSSNYSSWVLSSLYYFCIHRNIEKTLKSLDSAEKFSNNDFVWLYNKAFVLMYIEEFKESLRLYKKLLEINFQNEDLVVDQCIEFNKSLYDDELDKKQCLFIIGYLYLKKSLNFPMALDYLEKFINDTKGINKYDLLIKEACLHLNEVNDKMNL